MTYTAASVSIFPPKINIQRGYGPFWCGHKFVLRGACRFLIFGSVVGPSLLLFGLELSCVSKLWSHLDFLAMWIAWASEHSIAGRVVLSVVQRFRFSGLGYPTVSALTIFIR